MASLALWYVCVLLLWLVLTDGDRDAPLIRPWLRLLLAALVVVGDVIVLAIAFAGGFVLAGVAIALVMTVLCALTPRAVARVLQRW